MKKQRKVIRFDYTKLETEQDYRFWGIHPKAGRLHIDTKRYQKIILDRGFNEFIHDGMLVNRTTPYFIPEKIKQHDYKINLFKDFLHDLKEDWFYEYKPVFEKIKTPGEVQQNVRLAELSYMSSSEDYDLADEAGFMAMIKRMPKYDEIIHSLYIQFIQKICIEVNRYILLVCVELGYKSRDFDFNSFLKFSDGLTHNKNGIKIESLRGFNAYNLLNKINNFLKHNTVASYEKIRRYYPKNVRSVYQKLLPCHTKMVCMPAIG